MIVSTHYCRVYMFHFHADSSFSFFFFFNDTATTEIYTLSLHDALPISLIQSDKDRDALVRLCERDQLHFRMTTAEDGSRSEEHTSELQSLAYLVCRLLLEKKKNKEWM